VKWLLTEAAVATFDVADIQLTPLWPALMTLDELVEVQFESNPDVGKTAGHSCLTEFAQPSLSKRFASSTSHARTSSDDGSDDGSGDDCDDSYRPRFL
jgi:hypothetical protein